MLTKVKIALQAPYTDKTDRFFSLRLKQDLNNEPSKYRRPEKMLVVSDIEGDFRTFCNVLYKSRVINRDLQWTFEGGHLVIVGNCFDNKKSSIEYLWFIYSLEEKARRKGGYVHFILGNNEIMNLNGAWRYEHPRYATMSSSSRNPSTALYDANYEIWRWLRTKNIMEKIGEVLFVHGGIAHELLESGLSVTGLNNLARSNYIAASEVFETPLLHLLFNSQQSPFQYQGYYQQAVSEEQIDAILRHFSVQTIVTGHTIVDRITAFYNGKVINVDTDHANGKSEALFIRGHRFYRLDGQGTRERIK
jgi:hypothetical protein